MDPNDIPHDPNNPQADMPRLLVHSQLLPWNIAALVAVIAVVGVVALFWAVSHPRSEKGQDEQPIGTSGYYSTEGGHDPLRRLGSTQDELKFRGDTTRPVATPQSADQRR